MKKLILTIIVLFVSIMTWAGSPAKVLTLMNEYKHHEGFDSVTIGPLGLSLMKSIVLSDKDLDDEDRKALQAFKQIRRLSVLDFGDAEAQLKARFVSKVSQVLNGMELLLEAKDSSSRLSIYGVDDGGTVRDCVLFDPEGTLICVKGKIDMESLMQMAQ